MEGVASLQFNCFTIIAFLYLIVTSELPPGADCTHSKSTSTIILSQNAGGVISTDNHANYFNLFRKSPSVLNDKDNPYLTSSLSTLSSPQLRIAPAFSQSSSDASSKYAENVMFRASSTNQKRKLTTDIYSHSRNAIRNNIIPNLANDRINLAPSYLPSIHDLSARSSYSNKDEDNGISATESSQRSSNTNTVSRNDYEQMERSTLRIERGRDNRNGGSKSRRAIVPLEKSSQPLVAFPVERRQREKVAAKSAALGPFPVAYLMNSHYELDYPSTSTKSLDSADEGDGNDDKTTLSSRALTSGENNNNVVKGSRRRCRDLAGNDPEVTHVENFAMPLQNNVGDESNTESEISSDLITLSPVGAALSEATMIPSSLKDLDSTSPSDETGGINETIDDEKLMLNNQTAGTTRLRGKCNDTLQCFGEHVECRLGICKCQLGYLPRVDNGELCGEASAHHVEVPTTDPTMIGVVVGLALMSVTLCVVLRLFAKARFRENRTIFNTPNPRLMNVSLLKGSKTLLRGNSAGGAGGAGGGGGQRSRRGSQVSMGSGQAEGQSPVNTIPDGNGSSAAAGSSHPHRVKPSRTLSTDTTNLEGTPTSSKPSGNRSKFRQDSVASNV